MIRWFEAHQEQVLWGLAVAVIVLRAALYLY